MADRESDWTRAALTVFRSVSQPDRLLHGMFRPSCQGVAPAAAAQEALAEFAEIEAVLQSPVSQTGRLVADK